MLVTNRQLLHPDRGALDIPDSAFAAIVRETLEGGRSFRFRAHGKSMAPFIQDGDAITLAPLTSARPSVGHAVAFVSSAQAHVVVHRVVGRQGETLLIRADNSAAASDGLVSPEFVLGRVVRVERNGQRVWLGLGLERYAIAWLSREKLLVPLTRGLAALLRLVASSKQGGHE